MPPFAALTALIVRRVKGDIALSMRRIKGDAALLMHCINGFADQPWLASASRRTPPGGALACALVARRVNGHLAYYTA